VRLGQRLGRERILSDHKHLAHHERRGQAGRADELASRVLRRLGTVSCISFSSVAQPVLRAINECPRIRADIRARAVVRAPIGVAAALLGPRQRARSGSDYDSQSDRYLGEHGGVS
jgi:hypothetical protein